MTEQVCDELVNEYTEIDLSGLGVCGVFIEPDGDKAYEFRAQPAPDSTVWISCLDRGYIAGFKLHSSGRLSLEYFQYYSDRKDSVEQVKEDVVGNFWLALAETYFGLRVYLPFRNGVVVSDTSQWVFETRPPPLQIRFCGK